MQLFCEKYDIYFFYLGLPQNLPFDLTYDAIHPLAGFQTGISTISLHLPEKNWVLPDVQGKIH